MLFCVLLMLVICFQHIYPLRLSDEEVRQKINSSFTQKQGIQQKVYFSKQIKIGLKHTDEKRKEKNPSYNCFQNPNYLTAYPAN